MNDRADIDRVLEVWLGDGPSRMPDRVVDIVAARISHQPQRPSWRGLTWRANHMNGSLRIAAVLAAVLVIGLVGFGLFGPRGSESVGAPGGSPTTAPSASPAPSSAAPSPTFDLGVARACDLVTAAELATALNLSSTVTPDPNISGSNGDVNYCIYRTAGADVLGTSYRKNGGAAVFESWKSNSGVQPVSGLGDEAIWDPTQATLFILKGSSLVSIEGGSTPLTLEVASAVGTIAVTRM